MSEAPSMPFFVDAYLADTTHLSTEEHGAYLLLLMAMWRRGGSVPDDDTDNARMVGLSRRRWQEMKARLRPFLVIAGGEISQKRLQKEWDFVRKRRDVSRQNGSLGGRPRLNEINGIAKPTGYVQVPSSESTHTQVVRKEESDANASVSEPAVPDHPVRASTKKPRGAYPPEFEALWTAYPTDRLMSKKSAFAVWQRLDDVARSMALSSCSAFRAYCAQNTTYRPVHLVRYLNQERFLGFGEVAAKAAGRVFVAKGTPAWLAWQRIKPTPAVQGRNGESGWWFDGDWPPNGNQGASA